MAKILVADDQGADRLNAKKILEKAGHIVETASDGGEAVSMVESFKPDILVLDIVMAPTSGMTALRTLRKTYLKEADPSKPETKTLPIIMLSSKSLDSDRDWSLKSGANAYCIKPADENLVQAVKALLAA